VQLRGVLVPPEDELADAGHGGVRDEAAADRGGVRGHRRHTVLGVGEDHHPSAEQIESEDSLSTSTIADQPTELDPEVRDLCFFREFSTYS
jgi:hypothetical protein